METLVAYLNDKFTFLSENNSLFFREYEFFHIVSNKRGSKDHV